MTDVANSEKRLTAADRNKRRGYNEATAKKIANSPRIKAKNRRAAERQKLKDKFIADHPELVDEFGVFHGETFHSAAVFLARSMPGEDAEREALENNWQAVAPPVEPAKD